MQLSHWWIAFCIFLAAPSLTSAAYAGDAFRVAPVPSSSLSVEWSMSHDPEALDCLIKACRNAPRDKLAGTTGMTKYEKRVEDCKAGHLARLVRMWKLLSHDPPLRPLVPGERERLLNELAGCIYTPPRVIPAKDPAAARQEPVKLATSKQTLVPIPSPKARLQAAERAKQATEIIPAKAAPQRSAAVSSGSEFAGECRLPPHFRQVVREGRRLLLSVKPGADFIQLQRSPCIAKNYFADVQYVVATNPVEVTIPYCKTGARVRFNPTRYDEVLSGKRRLAPGTTADTEFLDRCINAGGLAGTALQAGQQLSLHKRPAKIKSEDGQEPEADTETVADAKAGSLSAEEPWSSSEGELECTEMSGEQSARRAGDQSLAPVNLERMPSRTEAEIRFKTEIPRGSAAKHFPKFLQWLPKARDGPKATTVASPSSR